VIIKVPVGLLAVGEPFRLAVPLEVGLGLQRDVGNQRGYGAPVAGFDIAVAGFPAPHAIKEIPGVLRGGIIFFDLARLDHCLVGLSPLVGSHGQEG